MNSKFFILYLIHREKIPNNLKLVFFNGYQKHAMGKLNFVLISLNQDFEKGKQLKAYSFHSGQQKLLSCS
jgi:hypothetical protein